MNRFTQFIVIVLISLGLLEIVVRMNIEHPETARTFWLSPLQLGIKLPPYPDPLTKLQDFLDRTSDSNDSLAIYDADLGYTYRPGYADPKTLMIHNSQSIRVGDITKEYSRKPDSNTLRIAIFGDSFSHGDGVAYTETWGHHLEMELRSQGIEAEVLNFGVGGYGMDQAFLRYLNQGVKFRPDLVIFGFSIENTFRNLYLFRYFYKHGQTTIPLSKPRFLLKEDELHLINHPTPKPEEIPDILRNFSGWKYGKYDRFYFEDEYQKRFWHHLESVTLLVAIYRRYRLSLLGDAPNGEGYLLAQAIINAFAQSAIDNQSDFLIVHLPPKNHLPHYAKTGAFGYDEQLKTLESRYSVVRPEKQMLNAVQGGSIDSLFGDVHFSRLGHMIIGEAAARYIADDSSLSNH